MLRYMVQWLMKNSLEALTRFVFLYGFVFKVSKHDLEPVRVIGSQHPETGRDTNVLHKLAPLYYS